LTHRLDQADGFENRRTCEHAWQPISFVFETELWTLRQRSPDSMLNLLEPPDIRTGPKIDIVPQVRQPDPNQARVYCVCMKCASHTYIVTQFIDFYLGGDRPIEPKAEDELPTDDAYSQLSSKLRSNKPQRILFWDDVAGRRPQDFVRSDVEDKVRHFLARVLSEGETIEHYKGSTTCRICGAMLGSHDLSAYGFIWPEKAEHYILEHAVWTADCALLVERAATQMTAETL
jgi:hypothetical protein